MFNHILIPLDGSSEGEKVLDYLPTMVEPAKTRLELVTVLDYGHLARQRPVYLSQVNLIEARTECENYLQKTANRCKKRGYDVFTTLVEGLVVDEILHVATTSAASLIAMTTHGRTGLAHFAMGSVAEQLLRNSHLPVLTVRSKRETTAPDKNENKIKKILVALDGSELAEQVLPFARALAQTHNATIHLLQVVTTADVEMAAPQIAPAAMLDKATQMRFTLSDSYLGRIAQNLQMVDINCTLDVVLGDPARMIVDAAGNSHSDVIMMATHGRMGLSRFFNGSVTESVISHSECPVLALRVDDYNH